MKRFNPALFVSVSSAIGMISGMIAQGDYIKAPVKGGVEAAILNEAQAGPWREAFTTIQQRCEEAGLYYSAQHAGRLIDLFSQTTVNLRQLEYECDCLNNLIKDEMTSSSIFFEIELDEKHFVVDRHLFGEGVTKAFPSAVVDIEEAGKCLAFERNTACVFHLMRVMEVGLRVLGDTLKLPPSTNRTWDNILGKCDKEQAKPYAEQAPEWQTNGTFLAEATAMLRSVKDAWRNPTMHVEKVYTKEQAQDIWNAVKGLMRQLSTNLKEDM